MADHHLSAPSTRASSYVPWVAIAVTWSLLLVLLAAVLPVHTVSTGRAGVQPRHPLVRDFGYGVLVLAAVPLIVSVAVAALLRVRARARGDWPTYAAWGLAIALLLLAIIGFATIIVGIFVIPVGVFLCVAVRQPRRGPVPTACVEASSRVTRQP